MTSPHFSQSPSSEVEGVRIVVIPFGNIAKNLRLTIVILHSLHYSWILNHWVVDVKQEVSGCGLFGSRIANFSENWEGISLSLSSNFVCLFSINHFSVLFCLAFHCFFQFVPSSWKMSKIRETSFLAALFSDISERNDYSGTPDFRWAGRWRWSHFSFWRSLITNSQC